MSLTTMTYKYSLMELHIHCSLEVLSINRRFSSPVFITLPPVLAQMSCHKSLYTDSLIFIQLSNLQLNYTS